MAITINLPKEQETSTTDTISITGSGLSGYSAYDYGAIPTLTTSDLSSLTMSDISISNTTGTGYTIGGNIGAVGSGLGLGHANVIWQTTTGTNTNINWNQSAVGGIYANPMELNQSGKVSLKGENADIDINGKSMVKWMQAMEERMNWMQPNVELEKEWDDLKKLGDRYRKLEQKCREKAEMWKKLKSMPKPEIR